MFTVVTSLLSVSCCGCARELRTRLLALEARPCRRLVSSIPVPWLLPAVLSNDCLIDATVKASAAAHPAPLYQTAAEAETETEPIEAAEDVQTDPTIANAGLTEIDAGTDTALTNGHSDEAAADSTIPNADVGDAAANTAGENQWDTGNDLAASQEWVKVPTPSETSLTVDAPAVPVVAAAAPAAANTASWADDHPETTPEVRRQHIPPPPWPSLLTFVNRLRPLPIPTTVSSLSSAVVETVVDVAVVVEVAFEAMASVAADVVAPEAVTVAVPAVTLPRRRPRGRVSATCGGDEDLVVAQAFQHRTATVAHPLYSITCISSQTHPGARSVRTRGIL